MPLPQSIKRATFRVLTQTLVNRALVRPLRRFGAGRVDVIKRLPVVGTFTTTGFDGCTVKLQSGGRDSIASRLFWRGLEGFEPESLGPFYKLARASDGVLDIGANTGIYALVGAAGNPGATVIAFEPVPEIFEYLSRNAELNRFSGLRVERLALGDSDGEIEFYVPAGITLATGGSAAAGFREAGQTLRVRCTTLDDYLGHHGHPQIDLIKMDTEATEPAVLDGASGTITRCRPVIVCEVLRGRTEAALQTRLERQNYLFLHMTDEGLVQRRSIQGDATYQFKNFLFVPAEKLEQVRQHAGVPITLG